jgi:hypothetical protein
MSQLQKDFLAERKKNEANGRAMVFLVGRLC